jgi:EmrB/QacA subfamily drug resistance transporter
MVQLDGTGVSIATPTIGRELSASLAELQWISASYLLTISATVVLGGWLGDRYGCRPVFLAGTVLFTACSAGCALTGTVGPLLALRVGQGFAAALVLPTSFAILRAAYPGPALARAIGIASGCASVPLVVGPILAGALVSSLGWQGVFLLAVPVGVAGLAATRGAAAPPAGQPHGFDPLGTLLLAAGLGLLTAGLTAVPARGWTAAGSAGLVVAGVALGAAFLAQERRATAPLLPPRVLRSAPLSVALVALLAYAAAFFGLAFFLGLDLQRAQGYGPVAAGVRLLPLTAGLVLAGPLTGTVLSRAGSRVALAGSAAAAAVAFAGYATLPSTTFGWPVAGLFGVLGLSLGGVQVAATHLVVSCAEDGLGGSVSSLQGVAVQTGGAVGIAALGSVLSAAAGSRFMSLTAEDPALAGAADRVAAVAAGVPQARLSLPPGLPEVQATALRAAAAAAYEAGLQTVLGCCAVVLAGCAVLVLAVLRPRTAAALPAPRQT